MKSQFELYAQTCWSPNAVICKSDRPTPLLEENLFEDIKPAGNKVITSL